MDLGTTILSEISHTEKDTYHKISLLEGMRSEEHTSELQSHSDLVCRLLLEKKNYPKICMEPQKALNSQSNLEKEEQSWRYHRSSFQTILQRYSNQNSMVLA